MARSTTGPSARTAPISCRVARTISGPMAGCCTRWFWTDEERRGLLHGRPASIRSRPMAQQTKRTFKLRDWLIQGAVLAVVSGPGRQLRSDRAPQSVVPGNRHGFRISGTQHRLADQLRADRGDGPLQLCPDADGGSAEHDSGGRAGPDRGDVHRDGHRVGADLVKRRSEPDRHGLCRNFPECTADPAGVLLVRGDDASAVPAPGHPAWAGWGSSRTGGSCCPRWISAH